MLEGSSAPVAGSVFVITPEAGDAKGMTDSATAMLLLRLPANPKIPFSPLSVVKFDELKLQAGRVAVAPPRLHAGPL